MNETLDSLLTLLHQQPVLTLFLVIGGGYLIGDIRLGSFSFGPVAGVLFIALFFGRFGFEISPGAQAVGFALFIFSVGYQAGPRFFDVLRTDGLRYFLLALVIAGSGFLVAVVAAWLLGLEPGMSAGLLAGGLTSSPTLAAAQEAIRSGQVLPPEGIDADGMIGNVATGYAITYIFGLAGLITIIKLLPQLLGIDLKKEAKALEQADAAAAPSPGDFALRVYRITNPEAIGVTFAELERRYWDRRSVVRVRRDGQLIEPAADDRVREGDELILLAPIRFFTETISRLGEELAPEQGLSSSIQTAQIVVINPEVIGQTLQELDIANRYGVLVTGIRRMRIPVPLDVAVRLARGDIVTVVGPAETIDLLGDLLGHVERDVAETDMVTFAFGIAVGVLIGLVSIPVGQLSIGLGSAGGLLASGLIIGYLRSVYPVFGRMPEGARWILMEFGLLLFMAGVGLRAGTDILETLARTGPVLILAGIAVTVIPVLTGYLFGRRVLKIPPVLLLGGITGSMTSGASLSVVTSAAASPVPSLGYTGAYAFANVMLTIAGSVILFF
ncbi:MAG TPA: transporter [Sedimenticola thiotaurini]|uniref:Transporter n=1 Tax=Sedimenticola thiotaurini TaxID=1543721 RepID=A0A831RMS3_9GAMM|nr:transporter [Sedimenticola thiotaurini]